jgi:DNA-binding response OmpR family regulator
MESNGKKILIVEDEKPLARALELKLIHEGFIVNTISSGEGIIPLLETEKFSLIVCDLVMPKVDGFQVLKLIKEKELNIPVIILSNLGQPEDERHVLELGATHFFIKSDTSLSKIIDYIKGLLIVS